MNPSTGSCRGAGYHCVSQATCTGNVLPGYYCSVSSVCCDSLPEQKSCSEQAGIVCESGESCSGELTSAVGLSAGQRCCIGGECDVEVADVPNDCEQNFGTCEPFDCSDGYEEAFHKCEYSGDICCVRKEEGGGMGIFWIILLVILILLVALGIVFRKKLRPYVDRLLSKFKKKGPGPGGPGMPPRRPGMPPRPGPRPGAPGRPPVQRSVLPQNAAVTRPPAVQPRGGGAAAAKQPKAMDDVLKRLKQMSK